MSDVSVSAPHLLRIWTIDGERDYEIFHAPECTKVTMIRERPGEEPDRIVSYECLLSYDLEMSGLKLDQWPDGLHVVEAYVERIVGPTWVEHDGGIRFCEPRTVFLGRVEK